jgi:hypothetical protein
MNKPFHWLRFVLVIVSIYVFGTVHAQSVVSWEQKLQGENGNTISHINTQDSGVLMVTLTEDVVNGNVISTLIKSDANGNVVWSYRFGDWYYFASNLVESPDSTYFCAFTEDKRNIHVLKFTQNGTLIYSKKYDLPISHLGTSNPRVLARNSGGYYLASTIADSVAAVHRLHLMSLDANGNVLWSNFYDTSVSHIVYSVDTCANGDIILGNSAIIPPGNNTSADVARISPNGNLLWYKHLISSTQFLQLRDVEPVGIDSFYIFGWTYIPFTTAREFQVMLINGNGYVFWSQKYRYPNMVLTAMDAETDNNGNLVFIGYGEDSAVSMGSRIATVNKSGQLISTYSAEWYYFTSLDYRGNGLLSTVGGSGTDWIYRNPLYILLDSANRSCSDYPISLIAANHLLSITNGSGMMSFPLTPSTDSLIHPPVTIFTSANCPTAVGVEEVKELSVRIYPVPSSNTITIESEFIPGTIEIYDFVGKMVYYDQQCSLRTEIEVSTWSPGIYFARMSIGSSTATRKIIIE